MINKGLTLEIPSEVSEGAKLPEKEMPISEARGFLRGRRLSTQRYEEMKKVEKELE